MRKKRYRKIKESGKKEKWLIKELKDKVVWGPFQPFCRV